MTDWHTWLYMLLGRVVIVNPLRAGSAFPALTGRESLPRRQTTAHRAAFGVPLC